jgi:hypothetical protein
MIEVRTGLTVTTRHQADNACDQRRGNQYQVTQAIYNELDLQNGEITEHRPAVRSVRWRIWYFSHGGFARQISIKTSNYTRM